MEIHAISSPIAVAAVLNSSMVISFEDGLLETTSTCTNPSSSLVLCVDWLKLTTNTVKELNKF